MTGSDKPDGRGAWDNPGVTPDGHRNRMAKDGPRLPAMDEARSLQPDPRAGAGHPDPQLNRQGGMTLTGGIDEAGVVARADRRVDVHYEDDPDQIVKVVHVEKPGGPLPSDEHRGEGRHDGKSGAPVQDVAVSPEGPSVWEATPKDT